MSSGVLALPTSSQVPYELLALVYIILCFFCLIKKKNKSSNFSFLFQEKFEEVNRAYEFLCSRRVSTLAGPDPKNIVLILQTQSIIFSRYSQGKSLFALTLAHILRFTG